MSWQVPFFVLSDTSRPHIAIEIISEWILRQGRGPNSDKASTRSRATSGWYSGEYRRRRQVRSSSPDATTLASSSAINAALVIQCAHPAVGVACAIRPLLRVGFYM
jgi:shikimate kinase